MADDTLCTLIYLVEGESLLSIVKPIGSTFITELKKLIWEDSKNSSFRSVNPKQLEGEDDHGQ